MVQLKIEITSFPSSNSIYILTSLSLATSVWNVGCTNSSAVHNESISTLSGTQIFRVISNCSLLVSFAFLLLLSVGGPLCPE